MKENIKKLMEKGFLHIFGANVINKIIQFASSIFLVRLISKEQFGVFSYAQNIISIFLLFNGLGVTSGMLQYGSETENADDKNSFFLYGIKVGFIFNLIVCILILLCSNLFPMKIQDAIPILKSMSLLPLLTFIFETLQIYFRTSLQNKEFSFLSTFNTVLIFTFSVIGAYLYKVIGIVIFRYLAYAITILVGGKLLGNNLIKILKTNKLNVKVRKQFMRFSLVSSFNNAISQLLYTMDIFLIGIIIIDESVIASYKIATLIPFALNFIPTSIMIFIYPYFARNNSNIEWIKSSYIKLTKYLLLLNSLLTLFLLVFAPLIIKILFGAQYLDSIIPFRILSFGYFIAATFRIPAGNVLIMLKEIKFGMYLSIVTGIFNIIFNVVLIKNYGSVGAAISNVLVFIFTSIAGVSYLMYKLKIKKGVELK